MGRVLLTMPHMHTLPPLKYKAAERLRFGGFLMRLGPEIEPCGVYPRSGPKPPGPVKTGAQTHGQGGRGRFQSVVQGRVAPSPLPCDNHVAAVGRKAAPAPPVNSFRRPGTEGSTTFGSGLAPAESFTKGARCRPRQSGPLGPTRAPLSGEEGGTSALMRPVRPWVSWGPWPPWPSWVHSGTTRGVRPARLRLVRPWVSWGPKPLWPSWVHSVGATNLLLPRTSKMVPPWASWRLEPPWPSWGLPV